MKPADLDQALKRFFKQEGKAIKSLYIKRIDGEKVYLEITFDVTVQPNEQPSTKKKGSQDK